MTAWMWTRRSDMAGGMALPVAACRNTHMDDYRMQQMLSGKLVARDHQVLTYIHTSDDIYTYLGPRPYALRFLMVL